MPRKPGSRWKGLDVDRESRFIGYDQAERMIAVMLGEALARLPAAVVGIVRGGLVPATMVSCIAALPLHMIALDRRHGKVDWIGRPPAGRRLLLVDDSCSTGFTMMTVRQHLADAGYDCITMTLVHDPETTAYVPDFSHPMRVFFRMPWDRGELTEHARRGRLTRQWSDPAAEAPFVGLDLDGVLLPDPPPEVPVAAPRGALPPFTPDRAVAVTGRPERDRRAAERSLSLRGYDGLRLECRPDTLSDSPEAVAAYKAGVATRLGCTHFIESDPEQAIRIAAAAPHLLVSWWSAEEARGWMLGAACRPPASEDQGTSQRQKP